MSLTAARRHARISAEFLTTTTSTRVRIDLFAVVFSRRMEPKTSEAASKTPDILGGSAGNSDC